MKKIFQITDHDRWLQAVEWHDRLRSGARDLRTTRAWKHWRTDARNTLVFNQVTRLYLAGRRACQVVRPVAPEWEQDRYDGKVPIHLWNQRSHSHRLDPPHHLANPQARQLLAAATGVAFLILAPFAGTRFGTAPMVSTRTYVANARQTKFVHLTDGSTVTLAPNTHISVMLGSKIRRIILDQGRALFRVAHYSRWPFVVHAGAGTITDIDTAFIVDRNSRRIVVTVTQGAVEVAWQPTLPSRAESAGQTYTDSIRPVRLRVGERFIYTLRHANVSLRHVDPEQVMAWAEPPPIQFANRRLGRVIARLQPFFANPVVVSLAARRIKISTLVYLDTAHLRTWIQSLSDAVPITVIRYHGGLCIKYRDAAADNQCPEVNGTVPTKEYRN